MFNMEEAWPPSKEKFREITVQIQYTLDLKSLKTPIQIDEYLREDTHFVGDFGRPPSKEKIGEILADY